MALFRYGREDADETHQMRKRIRYFHLTQPLRDDERVEVSQPCGYCTARLFLEGEGDLPQAQPVQQQSQSSSSSGESVEAPASKRPRTVQGVVAELKDLNELVQQGALSREEFSDLKAKLLASL